jgi:Na+:H+ antiporter, NhaA family
MEQAIQSFDELTPKSRSRIRKLLHNETYSGALLLVAATAAMIIANSPWSEWYFSLSNTVIGPEAIHLDLKISTWAADGLLAIFFFVAGMELKYELVSGSLSNRANAAVPIAAALGGMIVPAVIFFAINAGTPSAKGWGIPMATDIAFALAVLGIAGRRLPIELRAFLLSLAVVDDLGAIMVIAIFYSSSIALTYLLASAACVVVFACAQRKGIRSPLLYLPLGLATWVFLHESGVHATIAGVALGLAMRIKTKDGETESPLESALDKFHPWSAGLCVPVFAFFAAGISIVGISVAQAFSSPVSVGVMLGLVVGKPIGILGFAWLAARFTKAELSKSLYWGDVLAIGLLAGVGFTVSLLITKLAFVGDAELDALARLSVLMASVIAATLAVVALQIRKSVHLLHQQ